VCNVKGSQSVKSMTTAPGGAFEGTAQGSSIEAADLFGLVKSYAAARSARSVTGDVVAPGTGLVGICGVLGGKSVCEREFVATCAGSVCPDCEIGSLLCVEFAELVKKNARGSLKTGCGGFCKLSTSELPLDFLDWDFFDELPPFGSLPRFLGTLFALAASDEAVVDLFFGLSRFLVTLDLSSCDS
jgi:hypothetical protein